MSQQNGPRLGRMIPAMITPFDADREVDFERAVELGHRLIEGGSDALLIFGTTGESPTVDAALKLRMFELVKRECGSEVPVIANGDVCDGESALRALSVTGCRGLAIGRAALGDPWVFARVRAALNGEACELPDLQGNPRSLASLRGKYVIIDFWGSWCVWCIRGFPAMKDIYTKYKDDLEILGVACQDPEKKWRKAVEQYDLPWLQVRCPDDMLDDLAEMYGIEGFPTKAVVSPEGKLLKIVVGEDPEFYTYIDELLKD